MSNAVSTFEVSGIPTETLSTLAYTAITLENSANTMGYTAITLFFFGGGLRLVEIDTDGEILEVFPHPEQ